jgi:hypothetical protein
MDEKELRRPQNAEEMRKFFPSYRGKFENFDYDRAINSKTYGLSSRARISANKCEKQLRYAQPDAYGLDLVYGYAATSSSSRQSETQYSQQDLERASVVIFASTRPNPFMYIDNPQGYKIALNQWLEDISAIILTLEITNIRQPDSIQILDILQSLEEEIAGLIGRDKLSGYVLHRDVINLAKQLESHKLQDMVQEFKQQVQSQFNLQCTQQSEATLAVPSSQANESFDATRLELPTQDILEFSEKVHSGEEPTITTCWSEVTICDKICNVYCNLHVYDKERSDSDQLTVVMRKVPTDTPKKP